MSPRNNHFDPEKTVITLTPRTLWICATFLVTGAAWGTVMWYDVRSQLLTLRGEIWTRHDHKEFVYQLYADNHQLPLVVRDAQNQRIGRMP